ncbi:MAG: DnaA/Hda family protein, partial [Hydrogenoanaerobacterium sp.]
MESFGEVFSLVSDYCKNEISQVAHSLWIKDIEPIRLEGSTAYLAVKSEFKQKVLREKYMGLLSKAFEEVMGFPIDVVISSRETTRAQADEALTLLQRCTPEEIESTAAGGDYDYTFSTFIVGPSNKFAHAASLAVATNPAGSYNPLFIYGGSGLGKTHLLYAICNEITKSAPKTNIIYVKGEIFTNELIDAIRNETTKQFHEKYRQADALLVDDVQFIGGKESTQEEFFHT